MPKPTTPEAKRLALEFHNKQVQRNRPIPHFYDEEGNRFYVDRNGKGDQYFRNSGSKQKSVAARSERLKAATPTLADYQAGYPNNPELAKELFDTEQAEVSAIYAANDPDFDDVDHIHSAKDGGRNMAYNMRSQNSSINRSEGARNLTPEQQIGYC